MKPRAPERPLFLTSNRLVKVVLLTGLCLAQFTFPLPPLLAAPPAASAVATITFADGHTLKLRSGRQRFRVIPVAAGETVTLDVQLPPQLADTSAFAQSLDGGLVSEVVVAANGLASVNFQAGVQPGRYRLLLGARGRTAMLQFEVPRQP